MSQAGARIRDFFPLGHWDNGTEQGLAMIDIDLKEQAGIAMNVRGQLSDPVADTQVTLGALAFASDLGRFLWRMKYGQDFRLRDSEGRTVMHRATLLLANSIRVSGKFKRAKFTGIDRASRAAKRDRAMGKPVQRETVDIIERLAHRAIAEWIDDLCPRCDGRGVVGRAEAVDMIEAVCASCAGRRHVCVDEQRIPFAARTDGSGPMVFREWQRCDECCGSGRVRMPAPVKRTGRQICPDCQGSGRRAPDHAARAIALGVPMTQYRAHWMSFFQIVFTMLDTIDAAAHDTVRQLVKR